MVTYTYNSTTIFSCHETSLLHLVLASIANKERARQTKFLTRLINQSKPIKLLPKETSKDILTVLKKG